MKRQLAFDLDNDEYVIRENSSAIFSINANDLKFDSLKFYLGIYQGENKSMHIELKNELKDDTLKKGNYIYQWISKIITCIEEEFGEIDTEKAQPENIVSFSRIIPLYDMAACAGDGLYIGNENVPYTEYTVNNADADYAVRISGLSMEPTILNGSIVLVKHVELQNNDIGIFNISGDSMCKRYTVNDGEVILIPDNTSAEFKTLKISSDVDCTIQGKVIDIIN